MLSKGCKLVLFVASFSLAQYTQELTLDNNTIRLYRFNDDFNIDYSGHQNLLTSGELVDSGRFNGGLYFEETNDSASFSPVNDPLFNTQELTFEFLVSFSSLAIPGDIDYSEFEIILSVYIESQSNYLFIGLRKGAFFARTFREFTTLGSPWIWDSTNVVKTNRWYYVALVYDGAKIDFSVDGEVLGTIPTDSFTVYSGNSSEWMYLGKNGGSLSSYGWSFHGVLDEFRVSNVARQIPKPPISQFEREADTINIREDEELDYELSLTSTDCPELSLSLLDNPSWVSLENFSLVGIAPEDSSDISLRVALDCYYSTDTLDLSIFVELVNDSPIIDSTYASSNIATQDIDSVVYRVYVSDDDMTSLEYTWKLNSDTVSDSSQFIWQRKDDESRIDTISVIVFDGEFEVSQTWILEVEGRVTSVRERRFFQKSKKSYYDLLGRRANHKTRYKKVEDVVKTNRR